MPELSEVKVVADELDCAISTRMLQQIHLITNFDDSKYTKNTDDLDALNELLPLTIIKVATKGKNIFIELENEVYIVMHFRMAGKITLNHDKHSHFQFDVDQKEESSEYSTFYYTEPRRMGTIDFYTTKQKFDEYMDQWALPLIFGEENMTFDQFKSKIHKYKNGCFLYKLMDQKSICSGAGNYVCAETFYAAKLYPWIKCSQMTDQNIQDVYDALIDIFKRAYDAKGMTVHSYVNTKGEKGKFMSQLKVYNKKKTNKGYEVRNDKGGHGRTIWWCPAIQTIGNNRKDKDIEDGTEFILE